MPDGIYLDARKLGVSELAQRMTQIIKNKEEYYDFFKWHRYYSFHGTEESADTDDFCVFCATVNDLIQRQESSIYFSLAQWWNGNIQVVYMDQMYYRKVEDVIPEASTSVIVRKVTLPKKKTTRFQGEKPFQKIVSHTTRVTVDSPGKQVDKNNKSVIATTLRPAPHTQKRNNSVSVIPYHIKGSLDQANGSGSRSKQDYEFDYDYQR